MGGYEFSGFSGDAACLPDNLIIHPEVERALQKILVSKDTAERFIALFLVRVERICHLLEKAAHGVEWFGYVEGSSGLWCLKFKNLTKMPNIRILLTIDGDNVSLWHAFVEQKTADYNRAIECAERRIDEDGK